MLLSQVPEDKVDSELIKPLGDYYLSTGTSIQATAWNKQREAILDEAVKQRLLPAFSLELRTRMAADARHAALHEMSDKLWDYASRRPIQVPFSTHGISATTTRISAAGKVGVFRACT